jgi:pimeloyl-ACP methyl ester carboxylesterase
VKQLHPDANGGDTSAEEQLKLVNQAYGTLKAAAAEVTHLMATLRRARTSVLEIAYEESGPADGAPVFLMHGFPDDVRTWDGVAAPLAAQGYRVIVPYLRGYGPTRFYREHHALGPAGCHRQRSQRADGCAAASSARCSAATTGVARRLHRRGALAGAGEGPGLDRRLNIQDIAKNVKPEAGRSGMALLVPMVLQHGARRRRPRRQPARHLPPALEDVVAELGFRRCDLCRDRRRLRQSRLCRHRHSTPYRHRYQAAPSDPPYEDIERRLSLQSEDHRADGRAARCRG